jgi:hypothetical protein
MSAVHTPTAGCWRILLKKNCDNRKHHPFVRGVIRSSRHEADPQHPPAASPFAHTHFAPTCCFAATTLFTTPLHRSSQRRGKITLSVSTNDDQAQLADINANQLNPNNDAYWSSRGAQSMDNDDSDDDAAGNYDNDEHEITQAELENLANHMTPNEARWPKWFDHDIVYPEPGFKSGPCHFPW